MIVNIPRDEIEIVVLAEQDDTPVRGNALASGDDEADRRCEDEIIERLDRGDCWAWAAVTVEARWRGLVGHDYLGCCSYRDEADFRQPGDYFDDMVEEAIHDLEQQVVRAVQLGREFQSFVEEP